MSFSWVNKRVLLTGGTGSFGKAFVKYALKELPIKTLCIFSRDELKQSDLAREYQNDKRLRFFVGDVRDRDRVRAAVRNVDVIIHAAAMKRIEVCNYNPMEAVKTNILGTQNVISEAVEANVGHVLAISTDKAVKPVTLYGATKMVMENLVTLANQFKGKSKTVLSCARYGNVSGSRGSIIPIFKEQSKTGVLTITDKRMTRFWITLPEAIIFVLDCIQKMEGGEVFTPDLPSFRVTDLAEAINPTADLKVTGIRGVEKLHEDMFIREDGSVYDSGSNKKFLSISELKNLLNELATT